MYKKEEIEQTICDIISSIKSSNELLTYDDIVDSTGYSITRIKYAMKLHSDLFSVKEIVRKFRKWSLTEKGINNIFEKEYKENDAMFYMLVYFYTKCTTPRYNR